MTTFKNTIINDTTYIQPPRGTTSQRPTIYTNIIRWTNTGSQSYSVLSGVTPTLTNTSWTAPTGVTQIEVLVVAGGGGGGAPGGSAPYTGGGGGAGGLIYTSAYTVTPGSSYTVTVGAGGAGGISSGGIGGNGSNSVFDSITAIGGGGGGGLSSTSGAVGGSGGGGSSPVVPYTVGSAGTSAQGTSGGRGFQGGNSGGGGGGGAATAGGDGQNGVAGGGGAGLNFNISGTPTWYAGGGGATTEQSAYYSMGGYGGGGAGGGGNGIAGTASTGGGGGGATRGVYSGGAGGSGVVIIRYVVASDNTDPRGLLRYNTDLNDIEVYENSYTGWVGQDPTRNFGGHNLIAYSIANWSGTAATVTANNTVAPDGTTTASKIVPTAASALHRFSYGANPSGISGNYVTLSIYAKSAGYRYFGINEINNSNYGAGYDLTTGTVTSVGANASNSGITNVGNGWYRCWVTFLATGTTGYLNIELRQTSGYSYETTTGDGTSGFYFWGGQFEIGTYPGPFVNTQGVISPVPTLLNGYRTHTYTTTGTSGFTPAVTGVVEVLVVGGGGGGGANHAAGGGAGGVLYRSDYQVVSGQQYVVTVGGGGAVGPGYSTAQGINGTNSIFGTLVAAGGGGGGNRRDAGTTGIEFGLWGGSGGGGGGQGSDNTPNIWAGSGTLGQGYPGGAGAFHGGGGGGGAGGPGASVNASDGTLASTVRPGNGGQGMYFPQFAHVGGYPAGWFGGGGAGNGHSAGLSNPATPGWGGGGWPQDQVASGESVNGRANTGGGGGGSTGSGSSGGGAGGSGIVIVRYKN